MLEKGEKNEKFAKNTAKKTWDNQPSPTGRRFPS
jgi:hypothetical protein